MAYEAYNAYLSILPSTPSEQYAEPFNEIVKNEFDEATTIKTILHKGNSIKARVVGKFNTETLSRNNDDYQKIIFDNKDYEVNVGDPFEFDGFNWICTDIMSTPLSKSCTVSKCNNTLKYYDKNSVSLTFCSIPCIFSRQRLSTDVNNYMTLQSGHY
jgi:hypothetical protein